MYFNKFICNTGIPVKFQIFWSVTIVCSRNICSHLLSVLFVNHICSLFLMKCAEFTSANCLLFRLLLFTNLIQCVIHLFKNGFVITKVESLHRQKGFSFGVELSIFSYFWLFNMFILLNSVFSILSVSTMFYSVIFFSSIVMKIFLSDDYLKQTIRFYCNTILIWL